MSSARRWVAHGLDALAAVIVLFALFEFFVAPRLAENTIVPAPPVALSTLGGGHFSVDRQHGRLTYLDFWATWCEPCQQSIPLIQAFARRHPEVDVVSVDVGEPRSMVAGFVRTHPMEKVALDPDQTAAEAFGIQAFPSMVVIDPQGNQRAKWIGFNPNIAGEMAAAEARYLPKDTSQPASLPLGQGAVSLSFRAERRRARSRGTRRTRATAEQPPTLVLEDEPNSLDTIRNTPFGWLLAPLTQGYLFLVDDRGQLIPDRALALPTRANGGISPDGRRITYRIRTGRWSDGAPFDARDVGFTIDALRNPRTAVPDTSAVADVASWSVPRPDTLVVRLREPSAPFIASFLTLGADDPFSILPRHIAARYASLDQSSLDTNPVGLGPFRLLTWERGQRLSFVRNPYYWRGPAASPRLDVAIVPDAQTRLLQVRTGELDLTEVTGFGVDVARTVPNAHLVSRTTNVVDYLQFNLHSPALHDISVRRAMAMAIDRQKLASAVYRGTLVPSDSVQLDPIFRSPQRLPAYNASAAAAILRPRHLTVDLAIASAWRNSDSAAVQIASQLEAAGVTVHIRSYTEGEFWGPKDRAGVLESAHYDLALTSWSPALDPDRSYLFGCAATPPGGGNSMFFCDPAYDRDEARGARAYDPAVRAPFYRAAGSILIAQLPVLPLGFERRTYIVAESLSGFKPNPLGRDYWNAWELQSIGR
jgi:peptide/nickel transport system substrate-binding protein